MVSIMSFSTNAPLESSPWFVGKMERVSAEQFLMEVCVCVCAQYSVVHNSK